MNTWRICPECEGEGKHSKALGIISSDRQDEWSEEEFENYMSGGYDQRCSTCKGTGKVTKEFYEDYAPVHYYETNEEYYWKREGGY
jgi:RecJ-like exonuclease